MKLLVLGATGGIGIEIVRQAIEQGHEVTTFVRSAEPLSRFKGQIRVEHGDLLKATELEQCVRGHDAVLSAFGPRLPLSRTDDHLLRRFAAVLTSAMQASNVRRLVIVSTAFLFKNSIIPPAYLFGRLFFPTIVVDSAGMETALQQSNLQWTIVRPPRLTDKSAIKTYRVREGHLPAFGLAISRTDVADFMLKAVADGRYIEKVVGVSN